MDDAAFNETVNRLAGALQAHRLLLMTLTGHLLSDEDDPIKACRALRDAMAAKFDDAPASKGISAERSFAINQHSVHQMERFWKDAEQMLLARQANRGSPAG